MAPISYCSLDEAWGGGGTDNRQEPPQKSTRDNVNREINKYNLLMDKSDNDREEVINNMNEIERNIKNNNVKSDDYNKYRNNPNNIVKKNDTTDLVVYSPYKENIEKKQLHDKLLFLEKQLKYYQEQEFRKEYEKNNETMEHFSNINEMIPKSNDVIDLIILIIIGLLIIFVMDFVFKMGKKIGSK